MVARLASQSHVKSVWVFSKNSVTPLFRAQGSQPEDATPIVMLVDNSGSIVSVRAELVTAVAALLNGSNVDTLQEWPEPNGATNIVETLQVLQAERKGCDLVLITDGLENCFAGKLLLPNKDGESVLTDFGRMSNTSTAYLDGVANFVVNVCDSQVVYVGIGADSDALARSLVKRRNVHVASVANGSTEREVVAIVKAVSTASRAQAAMPVESRVARSEPIVTLTDEVQSVLKALDHQELNAVRELGNALGVPGHVALTTETVRNAIREAEGRVDATATEEQTKVTRTVLLLALRQMATEPTPAAAFTGKRCGVVQLEKTVSARVNSLLSKLVSTPLLSNAGKVGQDGVTVSVDGVSVKVSHGSAMYSSSVTTSCLDELSRDGAWCAPVCALKMKATRAREASNEGDESDDEAKRAKT